MLLLSFPSFGPINCWQHSCFSVVAERHPFHIHIPCSEVCAWVCACVHVHAHKGRIQQKRTPLQNIKRSKP